FRYGEHGKPDLAAAERLPLRFNVAHSGELVLVAVTRDRAIGVDLELRRDSVEWGPIAAEFFSPREQEALRELPADQQRDAFFQFWTRKEAFVKAQGKGLGQ